MQRLIDLLISKFWNVCMTIGTINKVTTQVTDWKNDWQRLSTELFFILSFFFAIGHLQLLFLVAEMLHLSPNPHEAWMTQISPPQRGLLRLTNPKKPCPTFHNSSCRPLPFSSEHLLLSESSVSVYWLTCSLSAHEVCSMRTRTRLVLLPAASLASSTVPCSINICGMI